MGDPFGSAYRGKTVLITGNTGFKGSWLSSWLLELGARVVGYALEPHTNPNIFDSIDLNPKIIQICGDVRNGGDLSAAIQEYGPEFVFHLAAQPLVRASYENPGLTFEINAMGTVNLLEAVRLSPCVRACLIITSDKCYANKTRARKFQETDPMGGYDPYSASKGCAELITATYRNSFFNPRDYGKKHQVGLSSARAGNVIGGGDWGKDRLISDCVVALSEGKPIFLRNARAVRPWQHVIDSLSGYLLLGKKMFDEGGKFAGGWNIGPLRNTPLTVESMVQRVIQYWGQGSYALENQNHPHEAETLLLDATKANRLLGFSPVYPIDEAIKITVDWYKNYYDGVRGERLYESTVEEIRRCMDRMRG